MPVRLDFVVAGFAKCGTTTLCSLLGEHPDVFMPPRKDYRLFDLPDYRRRWREFEQRFARARDESIIGDGSIWYTDSTTEELARERLLAHFPDVKLLFIARDPLDRIESSYREMHHSKDKYGVDCPNDLADALDAFPGMVEDTVYGRRLDNYGRHVSSDRILVVFLEELTAEPERELMRCFEFLGVDPDVPVRDVRRRLNSRSTKYRDAEELVELRRHPAIASALRRIPYRVQDEFLSQLGLRVPFADGPLEWNGPTLELLRDRLGDDARRFLLARGKPLTLWPRLAEVLGEC